jgi:TolA-binding protein
MTGRLVVGLRAAALLAGIGTVALPGIAAAQMETREGIALQNQILELRNQLESLRAEIPAGGSVISPSPAAPERVVPAGELSTQMLTRLATLEEQVRGLTGRLDELGNQVRRQGDQLTKQIGDLNFRLQTFEGGGRRGAAMPRVEEPAAATEPPAMSPPPSTLGALPLVPPPTRYESTPAAPAYYPPPTSETGGLPLLPPPEPRSEAVPGAAMNAGPLPLLPPPEQPPAAPRRTASAQAMAGPLPLLPRTATEAAARPTGPRTAEVALRDGEAALARRDYAAAEAAAREVLGSGSVSRAADAQFLLAQSLAGARNYPQAAVAYDDAYKRAPSGPHAQEALLGMASALASVGAKPAACAALDKLRADFLTQRAQVRDAAAALRQREACKS